MMRSSFCAGIFCLIFASACSDPPREITPRADAAVADSGVLPDSGEVPDAGEPADTGEPPDVGIPDAGVEDVGVILGPTIIAFAASPTFVQRGQTVTLVWNVRDAVSLTITAAPGGVLVDGSTMLTGMVTSGPLDEGTVFTLVATDSMARTAMQQAIVGVDPGTPMIISFVASPNPAVAGEPTLLSWEVSANTTRVRVLQGATELHVAPAGMIQMGSFMTAPLVTGDNPFTLEAWNFAHQTTALVVVGAN